MNSPLPTIPKILALSPGVAIDAQIPNNITIDYSAKAGDADTIDGNMSASSPLPTILRSSTLLPVRQQMLKFPKYHY